MDTMIVTISLIDSRRRKKFLQPLDANRLNWKFLDATTELIDGVKFNPGLSYAISGRLLTGPEIGCYCSHMMAWREFIDSEYRQLIVLEDDVHPDWIMLEKIAGIDWSNYNIDYLKLFIKYPAKFNIIAWTFPIVDRHLVQYRTLALGNQAYLLTRRAAKHFERSFRTISRPIDVEMDRPWATGIPVVGLTPPAVLEMTGPSSISGRDTPTDITNLNLLKYYTGRIVERSRAKLYLYFGRRLQLR